MGVGVGVGVDVGVGVGVSVGVGVGTAVAVGAGVGVGVAVARSAVAVGVAPPAQALRAMDKVSNAVGNRNGLKTPPARVTRSVLQRPHELGRFRTEP